MSKRLHNMLKVIAHQRENPEHDIFTLSGLDNEQLDKVERFIKSFWPYIVSQSTAAETDATSPANEPAIDISAQIDRLSQGLVDNHNRLNAAVKGLNERIDKVAEIIGERVSGLVDRIDIVDRAASLDIKGVYQRLDKLEKPWEHPSPETAGFPTGGASTAEAAADAVLPVPQRGDRVRLEGLPVPQRGDRVRLEGLTRGDGLSDGWYGVVGAEDGFVQVEHGFDAYGVKRLYRVEPWLIKEVRQHPFTKETDNVVD